MEILIAILGFYGGYLWGSTTPLAGFPPASPPITAPAPVRTALPRLVEPPAVPSTPRENRPTRSPVTGRLTGLRCHPDHRSSPVPRPVTIYRDLSLPDPAHSAFSPSPVRETGP